MPPLLCAGAERNGRGKAGRFSILLSQSPDLLSCPHPPQSAGPPLLCPPSPCSRLLEYEECSGRDTVQLSFETAAFAAEHASTALEKETGTLLVVEADVVVGADGLRSAVRRMRDERIEAQRKKANSKKTAPHPATSASTAIRPAISSAAAPVRASAPAAAASAAPVPVPVPDASFAPATDPALYPTLQYTSPLRYIGVSVILGLTAAEHPLIHQVWGYVWNCVGINQVGRR